MKSWLQNLILLIQNIIPWLHATLYLYFSYFFKVWNASLINFFFFPTVQDLAPPNVCMLHQVTSTYAL